VVVETLASAPLVVEAETPHSTPLVQVGAAVPRLKLSTAACGVGVALFSQTIIKYGAPFASTAEPTQEMSELELVGVEVEDSNSSLPSRPTVQTGGVLRTVKVVVAAPLVTASTFWISFLPILNKKIKAKIRTPVMAVKIVI